MAVPRHGTPCHGTARHSTPWRGTALHAMARRGTPCHAMAQHSMPCSSCKRPPPGSSASAELGKCRGLTKLAVTERRLGAAAHRCSSLRSRHGCRPGPRAHARSAAGGSRPRWWRAPRSGSRSSPRTRRRRSRRSRATCRTPARRPPLPAPRSTARWRVPPSRARATPLS